MKANKNLFTNFIIGTMLFGQLLLSSCKGDKSYYNIPIISIISPINITVQVEDKGRARNIGSYKVGDSIIVSFFANGHDIVDYTERDPVTLVSINAFTKDQSNFAATSYLYETGDSLNDEIFHANIDVVDAMVGQTVKINISAESNGSSSDYNNYFLEFTVEAAK